MTARAIDFDIAELFPEADNDSELVVTIPRSARACYELFADVERLPEWLPIIKSAAVRQRDEHERAIEVAYMATHDRSTVGYRLRYIYSERDLSMSWSTVAGSSIQISGSVQFTAMGEKACLMRYHVDADFSVIGGMAQIGRGRQQASAVIAEFRDFMQRKTPVWPESSAPAQAPKPPADLDDLDEPLTNRRPSKA